MHLTRLYAKDFRCFTDFDITPQDGVNVLVGDNASGKTSLLEAIFMLGRGQSFRGSGVSSAVRAGQSSLVLRAEVANQRNHTHQIGLTRHRGALQYRLDGNPQTRRLDLINTLPLQLIDPNLHRLLEQGPRFRRHFLDWGVFHVEHQFFRAWQRYRRALRQRNRALRTGQSLETITSWNPELLRTAQTITACRQRYVARINEALPQATRHILKEDTPTVSYYPGWGSRHDFETSLSSSVERDRKTGYTHVGPHRADLRVMMGTSSAQSRLSRGQQKVFAATLLLTQAVLLKQHTGIQPLLLVDDIAAELGPEFLGTIISELRQIGSQCFVTTLDLKNLPEFGDMTKVFHVERGKVVATN